jgi:Outer membrane lipoprotein-sorting protein
MGRSAMLLFPTIRAFLFAALCTAMAVISWGQSRNLSLDEIVSKIDQARVEARDHSVAYTVSREYQLSSPKTLKASSDVLAQINFVPPSQKDYTVRKVEGSDRGADIVRKVLDHESQMASHSESHEITDRNYQFALLGREPVDGHDCYVLQLTPRRNEPDLVRGKAWVDATNFHIRRIDGTPAKTPSWWLHNLHVTINYGAVQGIWTQLATKAVADVRLMGTHVLTSREVDLQTSTVDARNRAPNRSGERRSLGHAPRQGLADSAVWMPR